MRNNEKVYSLLQKLDSCNYQHSLAVRDLALEFENYFNLNERLLSDAALVHDVGKVYIAPSIIEPDRLTKIERELIDLHSYVGYKMLKEAGVREDICQVVLKHHKIHNPVVLNPVEEVTNKKVYEYAKMLCSLDAYDALTRERPYRKAYMPRVAIDILKEEGKLHDKVLEFLNETYRYH